MVLYFLQQRNPPVIPVLQEVGQQRDKIFFNRVHFYQCSDMVHMSSSFPPKRIPPPPLTVAPTVGLHIQMHAGRTPYPANWGSKDIHSL